MRNVRYLVQGIFLFLMIYIAVRHQIYRGGPSGIPPLDSYCPFGGIETAYLYLTSGTFLHRVGFSNFIMLFGLILMGVVLKSGFCGWICPFGTVQEWLGKLGQKVFGNKRFIPEQIDHYGRYLKYFVLVLIVAATIISGRMIFREWDPFLALFHLGYGELPWTAYFILVVVLAGSFFVIRFWCRYFCPLAVIVGFIGKLSLYKVECENEKCVECGKCEKLCPMDIKIAKQGRISTVECNSCLDCLQAEDVKDAISLRLPKTGKRLNPVYYPAVLILLFFGVIFTAKATGTWQTGRGSGKHFHSQIQDSPQRQRSADKNRSSKEGTPQPKRESKKEAEDEYKGEERTVKVKGKEVPIMGYMSLRDIERAAFCPSDSIIANLKLPRNVSKDVNIGKLKRRYGFQILDIRKYIREYHKDKK